MKNIIPPWPGPTLVPRILKHTFFLSLFLNALLFNHFGAGGGSMTGLGMYPSIPPEEEITPTTPKGRAWLGKVNVEFPGQVN